MSVGTMNIWVPDAFKNNCSIDNTYSFVATIQHCDGSILEWRGGRYQTRDGAWHQIVGDPHGSKPGVPGYYDGVPGTGEPGHVVLEAPPGCYIVSASVHIWLQVPTRGQQILLGNLATHKCLVDLQCGQHQCVRLFQPTGFHCGIIMVMETLLPVMAAQGLVTREEVHAADEALQPILRRLGQSTLDRNETEIARTLARRLSQRPDTTPPRAA